MSNVNLLKNTMDFAGWSVESSVSFETTYDSDNLTCHMNGLTARVYNDNLTIPYSTIRNKTVTLSCEYKCTGTHESENTDIQLCLRTASSDDKAYEIFVSDTDAKADWTQFATTLSVTDDLFNVNDVSDDAECFIRIYNMRTGVLDIRNLKLEISAGVTDWCPNVSDSGFERWLYVENYAQKINITVYGADDTFTLSDADIISGSLSVDRYSVTGDKVEIGSAIAGELSFTLDNHDGRFNDTNFAGAELYVQMNIADWENNPETIFTREIGYFKVDGGAPRKLSTIKITALDRMCKFDTIAEFSSALFPMTVGEMVERCCSRCGITLSTNIADLPNYSYQIKSISTQNGEKYTYRTLLQWCCALMGVCAQINASGNLELKWYDDYEPVAVIRPGNRFNSDIYEKPISITGLTYTQDEDTVYNIGRVQDYATNYATGTSTLELVSTGGTVSNGKWNKTSNGGTVENVTLEDSPIYGITRGVRITKTVSNDQIGICQNSLSVKQGDVYTLSCWVKPSTAGLTAYLLPFFGGGVQGDNYTVSLKEGWQKLTVTSTVPKDATTNIAYIHISSATSNAVGSYMDVCAVKVEKGEESTPWNPAPDDDDYSFYSLDLSSIAILQGDGVQEVMVALMDKLKSFQYRPYEATVKPMPWLNPMDRITLIDRSGNAVSSILTNVCYGLNSGMSIAGKGSSEESENYSSSNVLTAQQIQIIESIRKDVESNIGASEASMLELNRVIANSMGLYLIEEEQTNGSVKYYFCNASTLADSSIIYTFSANGLAWTTKWDGDSTVWEYGITRDGNAILNMIAVHKISADYISTGVLTSLKENAKIDLNNGTIALGTHFAVDADGRITSNSGKIADFEMDNGGFRYYSSTTANGMSITPLGIWQYKANTQSGDDDGYIPDTDATVLPDSPYLKQGVRLNNGYLSFYGASHDGTASAVNGGFNKSKNLYGVMYPNSTTDVARVNAEGFYNFQRGLPWLIKSGSCTVSAKLKEITEEYIEFGYPFAFAPKVVAGIFSTTSSVAYSNLTVMVCDVTAYGFTLRVANAGSTTFVPAIHWIAVASDERYLPVQEYEDA